jgi:MazG family protein
MIHSQVAAESEDFDVYDVLEAVSRKLIRRHPHVFSGDVELSTSAAVLERWESMKQQETPERTSVLTGIPQAMPALPYSIAVQRRAANEGFDWPDTSDVLDKAQEELHEVRLAWDQQEGQSRLMEELGDLIFALVSVGRRLGVDPEESLRVANRKFVARFRFVETRCRERGIPRRELSPDELDRYWNEAKTSAG